MTKAGKIMLTCGGAVLVLLGLLGFGLGLVQAPAPLVPAAGLALLIVAGSIMLADGVLGRVSS